MTTAAVADSRFTGLGETIQSRGGDLVNGVSLFTVISLVNIVVLIVVVHQLCLSTFCWTGTILVAKIDGAGAARPC